MDDRDAYVAFQEGTRLLADDNAHAAVIALERVRDLEPEKGSVREALARAYFRIGRFDAAEEEFLAALDLEPVNDYAHFGIGLCRLRAGDRTRARGSFADGDGDAARERRLPRRARQGRARHRVTGDDSEGTGGERSAASTQSSRAFVVCCDLDGVIWRGEEPIPGAAGGVAKLREAGLHVAFLTNNSGGRIADNVGRLGAMGIAAGPEDVATSAQAAAAVLARRSPGGRPRARVRGCRGDRGAGGVRVRGRRGGSRRRGRRGVASHVRFRAAAARRRRGAERRALRGDQPRPDVSGGAGASARRGRDRGGRIDRERPRTRGRRQARAADGCARARALR